uniref:FTH domain-containing protein n=1 Tax=Steinernema glaseri TaxID=37863 RepID=A0A1I7Z5R8_9BILA
MTKLLEGRTRVRYIQVMFYEHTVPHSHWEAFFRVFGRNMEHLHIWSDKMDAKQFQILARCLSGLPKIKTFHMTGNTTHVESVRTLFLEIANARRTTYYLSVLIGWREFLTIYTDPRLFVEDSWWYDLREELHPEFRVETLIRKARFTKRYPGLHD